VRRAARSIAVVLALAVTIGAASAAMAQAARWRVMAEMGTAPDFALLLIDVLTLTSPTRNTRTLTVANYRTTMIPVPGGEPYNLVRITYAFDCTARTTQRVRVLVYADGRLLSGGPTEGEVIPVKAGTLPGDLFEPACSGDFDAFAPIAEATPEAERDKRFGLR